MADETYDDARRRTLEQLLLTLAARIRDLHGRGELLSHAAELMKLIGDAKSELFHYEVRATYDTPEIAESRRIVSDAQASGDPNWESKEWTADDEDGPPSW